MVRRFGARSALVAAYLVQACGILISVKAVSIVAVIVAAATFGGTFMGIVAMTIGEGSRRMPMAAGRSAAFLTACFGVGQVIGPIMAGVLADLQQGFSLPLLLAAASVLLGALFLAFDRGFKSSVN